MRILILEIFGLQGIPDEYDEADINRLFSGRVMLTVFACCGQLLQRAHALRHPYEMSVICCRWTSHQDAKPMYASLYIALCTSISFCITACIAANLCFPDKAGSDRILTPSHCLCAAFPGVLHVRIVRDRGTGQSRGFGFVVSQPVSYS